MRNQSTVKQNNKINSTKTIQDWWAIQDDAQAWMEIFIQKWEKDDRVSGVPELVVP